LSPEYTRTCALVSVFQVGHPAARRAEVAWAVFLDQPARIEIEQKSIYSYKLKKKPARAIGGKAAAASASA